TVLVVLNAVLSNGNIHSMVENAYRITLAGGFVPLTAGLFWRRASNHGAAWSISLGLGSWLGMEIFVPDVAFEPQLVGLLFSVVVISAGAFQRSMPILSDPGGLARPGSA